MKNGWSMTVTEEGTLPKYGKVPFSKDAVTNILSLGVVTDHYDVVMDTRTGDNAFYVHTPTKVVRFGRNHKKIYTHIPTRLGKRKAKEETNRRPFSFVQSVEENKLFYTPREVKRAKIARDLIAALGSPSVADLKTAVAMNAIANLPIKTADIDLAETIFGPDLGTLKGKTTRSKPPPVVKDNIEVPKEIVNSRDSWELCIDLMKVNDTHYMTSITKALYYRTARPVLNMEAPELYEAIDHILRLYNSNG